MKHHNDQPQHQHHDCEPDGVHSASAPYGWLLHRLVAMTVFKLRPQAGSAGHSEGWGVDGEEWTETCKGAKVRLKKRQLLPTSKNDERDEHTQEALRKHMERDENVRGNR